MALPNGYTELEYIESHGTERIEVGYGSGATASLEIKMQLTDTTEGMYLSGGYHFDLHISSGSIVGDFGTLNFTTGDSTANTEYKHFTYNFSNNGGANIILFGQRHSGVADSSAKMKLYYAKYILGGTLRREYIPAMRNSDNEIGLFDLVSNTFVGNSGTGTFSYEMLEKYVTTEVIPGGYGTVTGGGKYPPNDSVTLEAVSNEDTTFDYWTSNTSESHITSNPLTFVMGSENITYYAHFKRAEIEVVFNTIIGNQPESKIVQYGDNIGELPTLESENATFLGWYTEASGGEYIAPTTPIYGSGTLNIYAHWTLSWLEPIYDRNVEDIKNRTSKAYLNNYDLNRIEHNIAYLTELCGISVVSKANWAVNEFPTQNDMTRIKNSIQAIRNCLSFTIYESYPTDPINHYEKVNTIEHLLFMMEADVKYFLASAMYCGDSEYCGNTLL